MKPVHLLFSDGGLLIMPALWSLAGLAVSRGRCSGFSLTHRVTCRTLGKFDTATAAIDCAKEILNLGDVNWWRKRPLKNKPGSAALLIEIVAKHGGERSEAR